MSALRSLVFIDSPRGALDRGWNPAGVIDALEEAAVATTVVVTSATELRSLVKAETDAIFWPVTYTFDGKPTGPTIVAELANMHAPYITCSPAGSELTSKLRFKGAIRSAGMSTPDWQELDSPAAAESWTRYPVFVKSEFSCDSAGVRMAEDAGEAVRCASELEREYDQRLFLESAVAGQEWSVACIVTSGLALTASLSLRPRKAKYIDVAAKADNELIEFGIPSARYSRLLGNYARSLVARLGLSGYFRVDLVAGEGGALEAIDLNILPCLESDPEHLSYVPMAFMRNTGCGYRDVLGAIVASANRGGVSFAEESALQAFAHESALLRIEAVSRG